MYKRMARKTSVAAAPSVHDLPISSNSVPIAAVRPGVLADHKVGDLRPTIPLGNGAFGTVRGDPHAGVAVKSYTELDRGNAAYNAEEERQMDQAVAAAIRTNPRARKHVLLMIDRVVIEQSSIKQRSILPPVQVRVRPLSRKPLLPPLPPLPPKSQYYNLCHNGDSVDKIIRHLQTSDDGYRGMSSDLIFELVAVAGARVLSTLHRNGISHCDIKPANMMLCESVSDGGLYEAKIVDFGLSEQAPICRGGTGLYMPKYIIHRVLDGFPFNIEGYMGLYQDKYGLAISLIEIALAGARKTLPREFHMMAVLKALNPRQHEIIKALLSNQEWHIILRLVDPDPYWKGGAKWIATDRKVTYKGKTRREWRSSKDGARAVKRLVKAADGVRRYRFERVH